MCASPTAFATLPPGCHVQSAGPSSLSPFARSLYCSGLQGNFPLFGAGTRTNKEKRAAGRFPLSLAFPPAEIQELIPSGSLQLTISSFNLLFTFKCARGWLGSLPHLRVFGNVFNQSAARPRGRRVKENTCEIVIACFCFLRVREPNYLMCFWGGAGGAYHVPSGHKTHLGTSIEGLASMGQICIWKE